MKIVVDESRCSGSGRCEALAPSVFEINDQGFVTAHPEAIPGADPDQIRLAVGACPNDALSIEE